MTEQNRSRMCWVLGLGGGIPVAVLLTWVFTAGVLRADFETVRVAAFKSAELAQAHEMRLQKLELNYEHLRGTTEEIKGDVKDVKRILERRPGS